MGLNTTSLLRCALVGLTSMLASSTAVEAQAGSQVDPRTEAVWLMGRVIDASTGAPVAAAEVRVPSGPATQTDAEGRWRLRHAVGESVEVMVTHAGFAPAERRITAADAADPIEVRLTPRPLALDELVVTAGRRLQRLADAPVAVELITRREIAETGATDLATVLTERTGVELEGGHPAGAGVMIQGMGSERVLVLMDGQPFIGRISGQIDVSRIPTSMIDRVEVVKGPQSTLYGSEAMGGVVNVITRSPDASAWSTSAQVTAGDQSRLDVSGTLLGGAGPVTAVADVGRRTIDLAPGQPGRSGANANRWDALGKVGWRPPVDGLRIEASGLLLDERQRWRGGQLYHFADNTQWSGTASAAWESGRHRLTPAFHATSFNHVSRRATGPDPVPGTGDDETQRLAEAELQYGYAVGGHALDAGLELRREAIRSGRVTGGARVEHTREGFVQATLGWDRLTIVPGVRSSWSSRWGTHQTPRLAVLYRPAPALALRVSAGEGFRAPAFKELYMEFLNVGAGVGYTVRGNPELKPEQSANLTASVEWAGARTYVRLQAFENRFTDFIETRAIGDSSGVTVYTYGNIDDGFTRGAEAEAGLAWAGWRVEGGYSLLRAEHAETGATLLGRPRSSARALVGYTHPSSLRVSVTGVYTGRTAMSRDETGTAWRDGYLRFDARIARTLANGFEIVAGLDNLFDRNSPEWPGFAGRHLYTSLSWQMQGERR